VSVILDRGKSKSVEVDVIQRGPGNWWTAYRHFPPDDWTLYQRFSTRELAGRALATILKKKGLVKV
jgi:hypothetical protein